MPRSLDPCDASSRGRSLASRKHVTRSITLDSFLARAESLSPPEPKSTKHHFEATRPVMDRLKQLEHGERTDVAQTRMELPTLKPGEQYRFHFDMTRCIGCRCCEVACNEQNGNGAEVTWRRVGEIEGGSFPHVRRFHISMACNHCLEPSCLEGCPTSAYEKLDNGIVRHNADSCIGCQYCTWNCPYGVPQYNPARRIVTKCHMCVDRLGSGSQPACVEACPVQAIEIEKVNVEAWRNAISEANAPGVPPADLTKSTTRITLPVDLPPDFGKAVAQKLEPEPAHWSLVYFLTVSQASVGSAVAALALMLFGESMLSGLLSTVALMIGHAALAGTLFHLGRPIHAFKALRAWRRSWLSREVVAFSAYAGLAVVPAVQFGSSLVLDHPFFPGWMNLAALAATAVSGLAGVYTSVRIYRIPARPAWDQNRTTQGFFTTGLVLGGALTLLTSAALEAVLREGPLGPYLTIARVAAVVLGASALFSALLPWGLASEGTSSEPAMRGAAQLLRQHFHRVLVLRTAVASVLALGTAVWTFIGGSTLNIAVAGVAFLLSALLEGLGRYLFFRCVVPRNMPLNFFAGKPVH
jgi:formate dehydrogenase iron-sulfur subunit